MEITNPNDEVDDDNLVQNADLAVPADISRDERAAGWRR